MNLLASCVLAAITIVSDGKPQLRLEHDGSEAAKAAAEILQQHVVFLAKTALPTEGTTAAIRIVQDKFDGYRIRAQDGGVVLSGRFPILAVVDLLRTWGCRFEGAKPHIPSRPTLTIEPRVWRNDRPLALEPALGSAVGSALGSALGSDRGSDRVDLFSAATSIAIRGLRDIPPDAARLGYRVRVASTTFDDFLPTALFAEHPEWFAKRSGVRVARGNFDLTSKPARTHYLDRVQEWLEEHPKVDVLGLWPEVTTVWCERAAALGHADAYALLWREAAARFPEQRFEILATGLTLRPPKGRVPTNVEVRLRPGRDASALQGLAAQSIESIVRSWELRGAKVWLEIDGAPERWCGLPWPSHDAIRADARRFAGAVLVHPDRARALLWHDPKARVEVDPEMAALLTRARSVRSFGDLVDAALLWPHDGTSMGARVARLERARAQAMRSDRNDDARRKDATDAWFLYSELCSEIGPRFERERHRALERMLADVLPAGAVRSVGPARVTETRSRVIVETARLRMGIDRRTATVDSLQRRLGAGWGEDVCGKGGRLFAVAAIAHKVDRKNGAVRVESTEATTAQVTLSGLLSKDGPKWSSTLTLDGSSALIRQVATVQATGGIAAGCRFVPGFWDQWICPSYAREGRFESPEEAKQSSFRLVPLESLFVRKGARGIGLALRLPTGGVVAILDGSDASLLSTARGARLQIDWILFAQTSELAH